MEIADGRGPALTGRLDSVDSYNPASYRGGVLRLHYARAAELEPWLDLVAVRGEIVVQFWLRPGEAAVAFEVGNEPPEDPTLCTLDEECSENSRYYSLSNGPNQKFDRFNKLKWWRTCNKT